MHGGTQPQGGNSSVTLGACVLYPLIVAIFDEQVHTFGKLYGFATSNMFSVSVTQSLHGLTVS